MDDMKILKRAWTILWNYRTLWLFGLILALTMGSATYSRFGSNSSYQYRQNYNNQNNYPGNTGTFSDPRQWFQKVETTLGSVGADIRAAHATGVLIGFGIVFLVLLLAAGIGMTMLRYASETAVIRMVNDHEENNLKLSFRQGFRLGWDRRAWRLFLIDLLIGLVPTLVVILVLAMAIFGVVILVRSPGPSAGIVLVAGLIGLFFLIFLLVLVYNLLISFLRNFIARTCALEGSGVRKSINDGVSLAFKNWKEAGKFWLIMIGLGIAWAIVSALLVILLLPLVLITVILGFLVAGVPGLLFGGFSAIFIGGYWPLVIGAVFALPLFGLVALSPWTFVQGLMVIFTSSAWTLVYRELKMKPVVQVEAIPPAN